MPVYEFSCLKCNKPFEIVRPIAKFDFEEGEMPFLRQQESRTPVDERVRRHLEEKLTGCSGRTDASTSEVPVAAARDVVHNCGRRVVAGRKLECLAFFVQQIRGTSVAALTGVFP